MTQIGPVEQRCDAALLACGVTNARAAQFAAPLAEVMRRYDIDTLWRRKHFLGQVLHESGRLRYREEIASGDAYEGRRDLGNRQRGDGRRFKGRGLIQLTGRANYMRYAAAALPRELQVDVIEHPEAVALSTQLCCDVAGWFWQQNELNALADRPDLSEYETCRAITQRINGGYNGLDDRLGLTRMARQVLLRQAGVSA
jgi:putative chitinase